jgi:GNAT superfamily N-acetyltransferase
VTVEIVDYAARHRADFERLNVEWLERYFRVEPVDRDMLGDPERRILAAGGLILMAEDDGLAVGTVALRHGGAKVYELTKMAVTPAAQGRGIGRRLLETAIQRYRALGGERLFLESHSSLETAVRLYERAGFRHALRPAASEYERADIYMVFADR